METTYIEAEVIRCISNNIILWDDIRKNIKSESPLITLALLKLEKEMIIKNHFCEYSFYLHSNTML